MARAKKVAVALAAVLALRFACMEGCSRPPLVITLTGVEHPATAGPAALDGGSPGPGVPAHAVAPTPVATPPLPAGPPGQFAEALDVSTFQRGNLHTHTRLSDGDSPPPEVYGWYRDHGYNFVAVTDHNSRTNPTVFRGLERPGFVLLAGEEITMTAEGHPVHVNALCTKRTIGGGQFGSAPAALAWAIRQVKEQGGVALVNHPNWEWALTPADVQSAKGARLLEIASGHPWVHTEGDATRPSHEAIWDLASTAGVAFTGVAVDDAHTFRPAAPDPAARPGRGWVNVFAAKADRRALCAALAEGKLYASTGASLKRLTVKGATYIVWPETPDAEVTFLGQGGLVLATGKAQGAAGVSYTLQGGEAYVRARVTLPDGTHAWTQPSRVVPAPPR